LGLHQQFFIPAYYLLAPTKGEGYSVAENRLSECFWGLCYKWILSPFSGELSTPGFCTQHRYVSCAGVLKLAASDAGVHVWATLDGALAMFAVGLDGGRPAHCPVQPAASTVLPPRQPAPAAEAQPQAVLGPGVHARTVRIGRLTVSSGDAEATYTSLE
jgi:hypothetical protein